MKVLHRHLSPTSEKAFHSVERGEQEWTLVRLVNAVEAAVVANLGPREQWTEWSGGWPNEISTALIDAIYSARAPYTTKHGKGIKPLVVSWQSSTTARDSIDGLITEIQDAGGPERWMARMTDHLSPRRRENAPGGPTKAAAVLEAARNLSEAWIERASDVSSGIMAAERALTAVSGVADATTTYFFMLLGFPRVKPDRMIRRFINNATGRHLTNEQARELLTDLAHKLGARPTNLERAIWGWQRAQD